MNQQQYLALKQEVASLAAAVRGLIVDLDTLRARVDELSPRPILRLPKHGEQSPSPV